MVKQEMVRVKVVILGITGPKVVINFPPGLIINRISPVDKLDYH